MKGNAALLLVIVCSAALCQDFDGYAARMNKKYADEAERLYRSQLYLRNMDQINRENSLNLSYILIDNQFTDRTDAEMAGT